MAESIFKTNGLIIMSYKMKWNVVAGKFTCEREPERQPDNIIFDERTKRFRSVYRHGGLNET